MSLAIFDLDNTLLGGDSDYLWGKFLAEQGVVDAAHYERENLRFYKEYQAGTLDIHTFLEFQLKPLTQHPLDVLHGWRERFLSEKIWPIVLPKAVALVERHRAQGDILLIITATNRFITEPIAARFGVPHLLASEGEIREGRYSGKVKGTPCFREGKVTRLTEWLQEHGQTLEGSWFYSDSHNDIPLLERVNHPVAVDPDAELARRATDKGWPIISLR
ncbi:MAG TPA: HAD family hydrolase [Gammaproteobacteria bacterium]|nr:HAD family hydrolase [Gammaproteobacteria bacterium]